MKILQGVMIRVAFVGHGRARVFFPSAFYFYFLFYGRFVASISEAATQEQFMAPRSESPGLFTTNSASLHPNSFLCVHFDIIHF